MVTGTCMIISVATGYEVFVTMAQSVPPTCLRTYCNLMPSLQNLNYQTYSGVENALIYARTRVTESQNKSLIILYLWP